MTHSTRQLLCQKTPKSSHHFISFECFTDGEYFGRASATGERTIHRVYVHVMGSRKALSPSLRTPFLSSRYIIFSRNRLLLMANTCWTRYLANECEIFISCACSESREYIIIQQFRKNTRESARYNWRENLVRFSRPIYSLPFKWERHFPLGKNRFAAPLSSLLDEYIRTNSQVKPSRTFWCWIYSYSEPFIRAKCISYRSRVCARMERMSYH